MKSFFRTIATISLAFTLASSLYSQKTDPKPQKDQPLKIISAPGANYTEAARNKGVTGTVLLTITLNSDGKVGNVACVNEENAETEKLLKYGLIDSAISAAYKIKFKPRIDQGVPVTVVITRPYRFLIY